MMIKTPQDMPQSRDAEMMVLGTMISNARDLGTAANLLTDLDFYFSEHKLIFHVLKQFHEQSQPADVHLVCEELRQRNQLKAAGGVGYLATLVQFAGTSAYIEKYCEILHDKTLLRRLIQTSEDIQNRALENPDDIGQLLEEAENCFKTISARSHITIPVVPIQSHLANVQQMLDRYRGQQYLGLCLQTLPIFNEKLLGLRKLMLLAAAPNVGKTALIVQMVIDALQTNPDACAVFLSLEMPARDIVTRICCHLSGLPYKTFVFGSQKQNRSDSPGGYFTESEINAIQQANQTLQSIGDRLQILDTESCPRVDARNVIQHIERLKEKTGCHRVFVAIDYLQVWPVSSSVNRSSELEIDKWRIGEMKKIRDAMNDDPVIVISEARKPGSSKESWGGDLSDIMGSARGSYTPDVVMLFQEMTPTDLAKAYASRLGQNNQFASFVHQAQAFLENSASRGESLRSLSIPKARDGMDRFQTIVHFDYRRNTFKQFSWDEFSAHLKQRDKPHLQNDNPSISEDALKKPDVKIKASPGKRSFADMITGGALNG